MKKLIGFIVAMLIATSVFAAPIVWTIPPTALTGGTTISGTFTFDAATSIASDINIVTTGTIPGTFKFQGLVNNFWFWAQQAADNSAGNPAVFVGISGIPAAGGTYTSFLLGINDCGALPLCSGGFITASAANVVLTEAAPVAAVQNVPTLGEYALLALASLMAMFGAWQMRKRGLVKGETVRRKATARQVRAF